MSKLTAMREGGQIHGSIRQAIYEFVQPGVSPQQIESKTQELISSHHVEPSFTKVKNYHWATCVNVNSGTVHGIPSSQKSFKPGDLVTVDLGIYHKGYHLDGAFTKTVGSANNRTKHLIEGGLFAIQQALQAVKPGNRIGHISQATEQALAKYNLSAFRELTGHGVGRDLHEDPLIPNLLEKDIGSTPQIVVGQTLAIEIIYTEGKPELVLEEDGWTISTKDDKLSGVFEETVEVTPDGYSVLTQPTLSQTV